MRRVIMVVSFVAATVIIIVVFFAYIQTIYNILFDLAEISTLLSVVAAPIALIRRCRRACATVWFCASVLNMLAAYLSALMLYMNWSGGFNLWAWMVTVGMWPVIYSAVASYHHTGHLFLDGVILQFGIGLVLRLAAGYVAGKADAPIQVLN